MAKIQAVRACEWKCRNHSDANDINSWISIEEIIQK